ncbi:MAG: YceI family protein, partial [Pseudomonadota bacterium]
MQAFGLRNVMAACLLAAATFAQAQENPFSGGWTLDAEASVLRFQSVKNLTKVESSGFASFSGAIADDGTARIDIQLDSVDTGIDLRNVRMRFLFFETFEHPTATITARIDPALVRDLVDRRRKTVPVTYTLDLHGISRETTADVAVTMITDSLVSVSSSVPISVATADHDLDNGIRKLQDAAGVEIVPSATVTFDFVFSRNAGAAPLQMAEIRSAEPEPVSVSAALEPSGTFDRDACVGRFEILSRTDNITFRSGSSRLDASSSFILDSIVDIVSRCPGLRIEVGGHTDA